MSPRRTWIATLPVAALLVAGCGGGGDDESTESAATTTPAPTALTKAELIERGDGICAEVNAAVGSAGSGEEGGGGATAQVADLYSNMVASLNSLGAPEEKEGYPEFSEAAEELATAENDVKLAAEREDLATLETAEAGASSALTDFQNAASEYGFEDCSEGPSAPIATGPSGEAGETGEAEGGLEPESVEPEPVEPELEAEPAPEVAPETGGAGGTAEGGGTAGAPEAGGGSGEGSSGGIGPG